MNLFSLIKDQCLHSPENIALIEGERQLSYRQLHEQVNQLGSLLQNQPNCLRVAIALDRGINATIAILSTLHAGSCYIPLDLKNPDQRLSFIINDANVQIVIGVGNCPDWVNDSQIWLDLDQRPANKIIPAVTVEIESLAAILYTSGSTGNPRGVALSHRAISNFSEWAANTFNISDKDCIASLAPFHFDLSVFDLFSSLSRGATVNFIPSRLTLSPSRLTSWLREQSINIWYTVPSILSFISLKGALDTTPLPALKTILFAGEVFPTPQLIKLSEQLPTINFYNLYGPTETNVCCYWKVNSQQLQMDQTIPIGLAASNSILKIDQQTGELKVKSNNNLSGYWQQGQLNAVLSVDKFYSTGDKVSINHLGEYCYHGRLDRMLKCSGYRVEPAEIEQIILQCPEVESCAVIGIKDSTSGQRPAAAIVLKTPYTIADIVKPIKQKLPAYMQPCKFLVLNTLPYLSNAKIDYQALQTQLENS